MTKIAALEIGQTVSSTIYSQSRRTGRIVAARKPKSHTGIQMVTVQWEGITWPEWQDSRDLEVVA